MLTRTFVVAALVTGCATNGSIAYTLHFKTIETSTPATASTTALYSIDTSFPDKFATGGYTLTYTTLSPTVTELVYLGDLTAIPPAKSAGVVTVTTPNGNIGTETPAADNTYPVISNFSTVFAAPGDTLTLDVAGADGVSATTLTAVQPPVGTLASPVEPAAVGQPFVLDHTQGLAIDITTSAASTLVVQLTSPIVDNRIVVLREQFPLVIGHNQLLTTEDDKLPVGAGGSMQIYMSGIELAPAGDVSIEFEPASPVAAPDGSFVFRGTALTVQ